MLIPIFLIYEFALNWPGQYQNPPAFHTTSTDFRSRTNAVGVRSGVTILSFLWWQNLCSQVFFQLQMLFSG